MTRLLQAERTGALLGGVGRVAAGQGVARALDLAIVVVFGRVLGPEGLGVYLWGYALVTVLRTVAARGMDYANVRYTALVFGRAGFRKVLADLQRGERRALAFSALITAALLALLEWAPWVLGESILPDYHAAVALMGLTVPVATGGTLASAATRGLGLVGTDALVYGVGRPAMQLPFFFVLRSLELPPIRAAVGSFFAAYLVTLVLQAILLTIRWGRQDPAAKAEVDGRTLPSRAAVRGYANSMWAVALLLVALGRGDRLVVTGALDPLELGLFLTALTVAQQVSFFLGALNSAFAPRIAVMHGKGELDRLDRELKVTTGWVLYATIPVLIVLGAAAPELLEILGAEFRTAWPILLIVLVGQAVNVGTGSVGTVLSMTGHQRLELWNVGVTAVLGLSALRLAATWGGVVPAAVCVAGMAAAANIVRVIEVKRLLRASPISGDSILAWLAGLGLVLSLWLIRSVVPVSATWIWAAGGGLAAVVFMISPPGRALLRLEESSEASPMRIGVGK